MNMHEDNPRTCDSPGRRAARYGALAAMALVAGYLEAMLPLPVGAPGVKLGLGNAVVLFALDRMGERDAFALMLAKVACSIVLFGNPQMLAFSLAGGALSWAAMALARRTGSFSTVSVSVIGGVCHNAGQLAMVALLLSPAVAWTATPVLAVAGVLCGAAVGVLVRSVEAALPQGTLHG